LIYGNVWSHSFAHLSLQLVTRTWWPAIFCANIAGWHHVTGVGTHAWELPGVVELLFDAHSGHLTLCFLLLVFPDAMSEHESQPLRIKFRDQEFTLFSDDLIDGTISCLETKSTGESTIEDLLIELSDRFTTTHDLKLIFPHIITRFGTKSKPLAFHTNQKYSQVRLPAFPKSRESS
jgi:hypothetical protein